VSEKREGKKGDEQPPNDNETNSMGVERVIQKHVEETADLLQDFLKKYEETANVLEIAIDCIELSKSSGGSEVVGYALMSIIAAHKALVGLNNELGNLLTDIKKRRKNILQDLKITLESERTNITIKEIISTLDIDEKHRNFT